MTGMAKAQIGKQEEARNDWEQSTRLLKQLIADSPTNAQYQADYLEIAMLLANSDWNSGDKKESLERYEDAIYQFEVLVKLNPGDPLLPRRAAQVRSLMGDHYMSINEKQRAFESYQKGIDHLYNIEIALLDKKQSQQDKTMLKILQPKLANAN
jgi:tetratricopeptide (TPR) repeat protein